MTSSPPTMVPVRLHQGEAMLKLAATYPTLMCVGYEQVQNALDVGATKIEIRVNLDTHFLAVRDNGRGVTEKRFHQALTSVSKGIKKMDALGRFGLGLISPLGKCREFTFTSCAQPRVQKFLRWTFNTEAIQAQKTDVEIPMETITGIRFAPDRIHVESGRNTWWRTEVAIHDYTADKELSRWNVDELEHEIRSRFGRVMQRLDTEVIITTTGQGKDKDRRVVKAKGFRGRRLPLFVYEESSAGKVEIQMFVTRPGSRRATKKRRVNIIFGELGNNYRFGFANFSRSVARRHLIPEEATAALGSGMFEGEIAAEKVELRANRTSFKPNDALIGLCVAIEAWYNAVGKELLLSEKTERQAIRYQDLGRKVLDRLSGIFRDQGLLDQIKGLFPLGTIGIGHTPPDPSKIEGEQERGAKAPGRPHPNKRDPKPRHPPQKEKPGHVPVTSIGPQGQPRRLVHNNSVGLQFAFDDFAGSQRLWRLDRQEGILAFNITHPDWVDCDVNDTQISRLMSVIAIMVVNMLVMEPDHQDLHQNYIDSAMPGIVAWLSS